MAASFLYCPTCGAANAPNDAACFACKQPLAWQLIEHEWSRLLHDRYQVLTQVGTGGFGAVYKALDTQDGNRLVAIKQINLRGLAPQQIIEATDGFNREVRMLSTLSHSHLPHIHAHFTDPEHWYVVMDFIGGETLEDYLRASPAAQNEHMRILALDEVLDIGLQICSVLTYLHTRQPPIVFRDLKPSNIMRTPQGQLYLIDFGTARYFKPGQTRDTIPLGSPGYAAPEQYGRAQTTPRADIYSLGALLHHLLSRHDPSETPFTFAALPVSNDTASSKLAVLVMWMVKLDAEQRPADVTEVEAALLQIRNLFMASEPRIWRPGVSQVPPPSVMVPGGSRPAQMQQQVLLAPRKKSRRKFVLGGLAVASSLALGGGVPYWLYWHPTRLALEQGFPGTIPIAGGDVSTIAWSPDGQRVAFGLSDGRIVGGNLSKNPAFSLTSSFSFTPQIQDQPINLLAWSPDSKQLVSKSEVGLIQMWNTDLQQAQPISTDIGNVEALTWSPNQQLIAMLNDQKEFYLYDTHAASFDVRAWPGGNALAWSPDNALIVTQPDSSAIILQIWEVNSGQSLAAIPLNAPAVTVLAWSPDGQYIAALSVDGTLQVWDYHNQNKLVFSRTIATQQEQLVWSPDSRFLTTIDDADNLLVLNRSTGETLISAPIVDSLGRGGVFPGRALTWLSDNQHIAVANTNIECWLWALSWL